MLGAWERRLGTTMNLQKFKHHQTVPIRLFKCGELDARHEAGENVPKHLPTLSVSRSFKGAVGIVGAIRMR